MHSHLRQLILRYPDRIRLVHHHFPMDSAYNPLVKERFHEGAGQMALLALYAQTQDKFWEMNDILFEKGRLRENVEMRVLGETLDLDPRAMAQAVNEPELLQRLWQDIHSGLNHHIVATPSFVINGEVHQGGIPAEVLQSILE
jgi:protein-disulfide isomerase